MNKGVKFWCKQIFLYATPSKEEGAQNAENLQYNSNTLRAPL